MYLMFQKQYPVLIKKDNSSHIKYLQVLHGALAFRDLADVIIKVKELREISTIKVTVEVAMLVSAK